MGGGYVTRPGEYLCNPDPNDPMTEFYQILQDALNGQENFALPGFYGAFKPPETNEPLYRDNIENFCQFKSQPQRGWTEIFAPRQMQVLYSGLSVTPQGVPCALLLTEEATHHTYALQLLPPVISTAHRIPPIPDCYAALGLQLTGEDLALADRNPAELGRRLVRRAERKRWLRHPARNRWLERVLSLAQRRYRQNQGRFL